MRCYHGYNLGYFSGIHCNYPHSSPHISDENSSSASMFTIKPKIMSAAMPEFCPPSPAIIKCYHSNHGHDAIKAHEYSHSHWMTLFLILDEE